MGAGGGGEGTRVIPALYTRTPSCADAAMVRRRLAWGVRRRLVGKGFALSGGGGGGVACAPAPAPAAAGGRREGPGGGGWGARDTYGPSSAPPSDRPANRPSRRARDTPTSCARCITNGSRLLGSCSGRKRRVWASYPLKYLSKRTCCSPPPVSLSYTLWVSSEPCRTKPGCCGMHRSSTRTVYQLACDGGTGARAAARHRRGTGTGGRTRGAPAGAAARWREHMTQLRGRADVPLGTRTRARTSATGDQLQTPLPPSGTPFLCPALARLLCSYKNTCSEGGGTEYLCYFLHVFLFVVGGWGLRLAVPVPPTGV